MTAIYKTLGSCPQENLLWGSLTGREHLLYYARLRGLQVQYHLCLEAFCHDDCVTQAVEQQPEHPYAALSYQNIRQPKLHMPERFMRSCGGRAPHMIGPALFRWFICSNQFESMAVWPDAESAVESWWFA